MNVLRGFKFPDFVSIFMTPSGFPGVNRIVFPSYGNRALPKLEVGTKSGKPFTDIKARWRGTDGLPRLASYHVV